MKQFRLSRASLLSFYYQEFSSRNFCRRIKKYGGGGGKGGSDPEEEDGKLIAAKVRKGRHKRGVHMQKPSMDDNLPKGLPWRKNDPLTLYMHQVKKGSEDDVNLTFKGLSQWFRLTDEERRNYVEEDQGTKDPTLIEVCTRKRKQQCLEMPLEPSTYLSEVSSSPSRISTKRAIGEPVDSGEQLKDSSLGKVNPKSPAGSSQCHRPPD